MALLLLWGGLGALRLAVWERHPDTQLNEVLSDDPQPVKLHGLVVDDPTELFEPSDAQTGEESEALLGPDRQVCVVALRHRRTGQGWQPVTGRVRVAIHAPEQRLRYGDEVLVEGEWFKVPAPGNPGQYDWQAALARKRIHGLLRVRSFDGLVVLRHGQGNPVLAAVFRLRARWARLIQEHVEPRDAGLLLALLLGERAEIEEELHEAFRTTGTIHLLVISGSNVGIVLLLLELFLRWLGIPWRSRLALCALGLGGYCALTGLQTPVVRATLMAWVFLGACMLDRALSWVNVLAAAGLIILWISPAQLCDPGFQLSFGAVLSLLLFTPRWQERLEARLGWLRPTWVRRYTALSLSATAAVWVGLWPVLAWYFHLFSPVSVLANLLVAPLVTAVTAVGLPGLILGSMSTTVFAWLGGLLHVLLDFLLACVLWCQRVPAGHSEIGNPGWPVVLGYYGLVLLSLLRSQLRLTPGRTAFCWLLGLAIWAWGTALREGGGLRRLQVHVLDVGHGDSILLRTPGRHTLLIDTGTEEATRMRVLPFLRHAGITTLDALILTHPDADHLGGAPLLLQALRVKWLLTNGASDDTMTFRRVFELARRCSIPHRVVSAGSVLREPGLRIEALHPPAGLVAGVEPNSNDNSIVLKVTYGLVSILLTGDIEEDGLPRLLESDALRSTVLKVPHHGSRLGAPGERFFRAVQPEVAVVSVGRLHRLPASETVQALEQTGAQLYTTRESGAVAIVTDGLQVQLRPFRRRRPAGSRPPVGVTEAHGG